MPALDRNSIEREARATVEYLQVRQRQKWLEREYSTFVTPKPPSHWFYLWIRQLLLPVYTRMRGSESSDSIDRLIRSIKQRLLKNS
jgi:hypothetical protein